MTDELTDRDYLNDLAERILSIPTAYGVDQGDHDRLIWIAATTFSPDINEAADRLEKWSATLRRIGEDQRADDMEIAIAAMRRSELPRGVTSTRAALLAAAQDYEDACHENETLMDACSDDETSNKMAELLRFRAVELNKHIGEIIALKGALLCP